MNDTDRTVIALLWHENLADAITFITTIKTIIFLCKNIGKYVFCRLHRPYYFPKSDLAVSMK